jgi:hypothetical protein
VPPNNEMKRTRPAMATMARPSPLISVLCGHRRDRWQSTYTDLYVGLTWHRERD